MIHSFTFKNFCSFSRSSTISFGDITKGIETKNNMFFDSPAGVRLSKVLIVVGPNASGKTNALKALAFLSWFARNSFMGLEGEKEEIPVDTFAFCENKVDPAEFELVFEHNHNLYKYIVHLCRTHVVLEELYAKGNTGHFNYLFKRKWNARAETSEIVQRIGLKTEVLKEILRRNVSLISASIAIKNDTLTDISTYWQKIISNVNRTGKIWDPYSLGVSGRLHNATEIYNNNKPLFEKVVQFLKNIDLGLETIEIEEASDERGGEKRKTYLSYGVHKIDERQYRLPFKFESSGTKNMFVLLNFLLPAIEQGGIAVIDELEIDLHPHSLPKIVELFTNPETNPNNSQLFFTSHSLEILNHLEKEQVVLVEKNKECKSEIYRLDEIKGVRRDDNLYAKYMAGAYGAVPNI